MRTRTLLLLAVVTSACNPPCATVGSVCTFAGTGIAGFNSDGLEPKSSWLYYPTAVAVGADGQLIIDDYNNYRVREVDSDGRLVTVAGLGQHAYAVEGPADESPLENAVDLDVADDGTLYVAEQHSGRILAIIDGQLTIAVGSGEIGYGGDEGPAVEAMLDYTSGVEVAPDGRIFVADTQNHVIRMVGVDGIIHLLAGSPGEDGYADGAFTDARFDEPQRMDFEDDVLYVADSKNNAIRRLDLATQTVTTVAGTGEVGFTGDGGPATEATLDSPWGVMLDDDGTLWVSDSNNHVIRRIDADGTIDTVAGTGVHGGLLNGDDPLACTFDYPSDVVIGEDGNLYIADMLNSAIRELVLVEPD